MNGERARSGASSEPVPDLLSVEEQRAARTALVRRQLARGAERSVRDADRRQIQHGTEVQGEAGATRVVAPRAVDEQHVRRLCQRAYRGLEQRTLAQGEQTRVVRRARRPRHDDNLVADGRRSPGSVAGVARTAAAADEANEDGADPRSRTEPPRRRSERTEP